MKVIESSGATREEAIQRGLKELGVEMHAVDRIDVIDEGSKGFLGMGKRPVRVRLSVEHAAVREPRESGRRDPIQERRPKRPQQQNRPNRGDAPFRDKGSVNKPSQGGRGRGGQREGAATQEKRGPEGRQGNRQDRSRNRDNNRDSNRDNNRENNRDNNRDGNRDNNRDNNRDRNRQHRDNQQRRGADQRPRQDRRPANTPDRAASNVSEESMEAHRLAEQFENINSVAVAEYAANEMPPNAREEEIFESITDEQGNEAAALLKEIISNMDLAGEVAFARDADGSARLHVESGDDGGILIGKRGITLEALQYLINRMLSRGDSNENTERVLVDVGDYVDRRRAMLRDMAIGMAKQAKETRRNVRLKPLSPQERRIIHLTLEKDPEVRTFSTGDSLFRSVVISPVGERRGNNNRRPRNGGRDNRREAESAPSEE